MKTLTLNTGLSRKWELAAHRALAGLHDCAWKWVMDEPVAVSDSEAFAFLLWACALPGWVNAAGQMAVKIEDVPGTGAVTTCGACGFGEAIGEVHVPAVVREAIANLCDAFDEDEIGQVDQSLIDALRPFGARM